MSSMNLPFVIRDDQAPISVSFHNAPGKVRVTKQYASNRFEGTPLDTQSLFEFEGAQWELMFKENYFQVSVYHPDAVTDEGGGSALYARLVFQNLLPVFDIGTAALYSGFLTEAFIYPSPFEAPFDVNEGEDLRLPYKPPVATFESFHLPALVNLQLSRG